MSKKPKQKLSLLERQKKFIFEQQSTFQPVHTKDFCAIGNVRQTLERIIHHLKHFREYAKFGAELYSGAIFFGPPGTGKTTSTQFLATESNAGFVDVNKFPYDKSEDDTLTRKDMHMLFVLSRKYVRLKRKPLVLFFEQFDAFLEDAGNAAINQLYIELSGADAVNNGIFVVAVTAKDINNNDEYELFDEQLLRKGRLGIHIEFTRPTQKQQIEILRHFLEQKPREIFDLAPFIHLMTEPTPATIRDFVNEAYRRACNRALASGAVPPKITQHDLLEVFVDELQGCSLLMDLSPEKILRTAVHELGHALVARELGWPVQVLSLIPASDGLGKTYTILPWDHQKSEEDVKNDVAIDVGGLAAEEFCYSSSAFGVCADLKNATTLAKAFIAKAGKGNLIRKKYGPMTVESSEDLPLSQDLLKTVDKDTGLFLKYQQQRALRILKRIGKERILFVAREICRKDPPIILQDELDRLCKESARAAKPRKIT